MSDSLARARLARAAARLDGGVPGLVLMTDDERICDPLASAEALPRGSMVVVRSRDPARLADLGGALVRLGRRRELKVSIAGDPLLAARLGADGFHLSERRAREAVHWRARLRTMTITASAHSLHALLRASVLPLDAIFLSPVFVTASHPGRAALSPVRANMMARASLRPVYALGGIESRNAALIATKGFSGIAAVGALLTRGTAGAGTRHPS